MFLSRIEINQYRRETMSALASPQKMHAAIAASFPPLENAVSGRVLWRIDRIGSVVFILVQSSIRPDFTHIVEQFGWPSSEQAWKTIDMDQFLSTVEKGQTWRFRLRANPTRSLKNSDDDRRGKVLAHVTVEQQKNWLLSREQEYGFKTVSSSDQACLEVKQTEKMRFKRQNNQEVTINAVTFEGILMIEDKEKFINTIFSGIGRAKAYGCGLLTIMRIQ